MERIPKITDERLEELFAHIKPVVRKDGALYYIEPPEDFRKMSFLWDPIVTQRAESLQEIARIVTYHKWGYHGIFKPSIAEVLAQIPEKFITGTLVFDVRGPETAADLNKNIEIVNEGYHVADTILYSVT